MHPRAKPKRLTFQEALKHLHEKITKHSKRKMTEQETTEGKDRHLPLGPSWGKRIEMLRKQQTGTGREDEVETISGSTQRTCARNAQWGLGYKDEAPRNIPTQQWVKTVGQAGGLSCEWDYISNQWCVHGCVLLYHSPNALPMWSYLILTSPSPSLCFPHCS